MVEVRSDQLVTVLSAAIFVFVGVDSNHFHYVLDFEVTAQGLVGDVPGGTAYHSEHCCIRCGPDEECILDVVPRKDGARNSG